MILPFSISPKALLIAGVVLAALGAGAWLYLRGRSDEAVQQERQAVVEDKENRETRSEVDRSLLADPARAPVLRERWTRD
jgi:hypothetical protein